jgi:hypothetical protein
MIKFKNTDYRLLVLPEFELWYVKDFFINEKQTRPCLGFNVGWLFWELYVMIKL